MATSAHAGRASAVRVQPGALLRPGLELWVGVPMLLNGLEDGGDPRSGWEMWQCMGTFSRVWVPRAGAESRRLFQGCQCCCHCHLVPTVPSALSQQHTSVTATSMFLNAGPNCQTNINECASNPCLNQGTCIDDVAGYTCNCLLPYTGERELPVPPRSSLWGCCLVCSGAAHGCGSICLCRMQLEET